MIKPYSDRNQGRKVGKIKEIMISKGIPELVVEQLHERLAAGEIETKDLIQMLNYFIPKLRNSEFIIEQEEEPTLNASQLWIKTLHNDK